MFTCFCAWISTFAWMFPAPRRFSIYFCLDVAPEGYFWNQTLLLLGCCAWMFTFSVKRRYVSSCWAWIFTFQVYISSRQSFYLFRTQVGTRSSLSLYTSWVNHFVADTYLDFQALWVQTWTSPLLHLLAVRVPLAALRPRRRLPPLPLQNSMSPLLLLLKFDSDG